MKSGREILREVLTFARFFLVGIGATLVHMGVAALAITQFQVPVFKANLIAFLVAFVVAFSGHFLWTFSRKSDFSKSLVRYFIIAASAFAINNLVLLALVKNGTLGDVVSVVLAAMIIPLISYTASRFWGFKS